jgi:hypothetical protein
MTATIATASVDATIAPNMHACAQLQPCSRSTYSRMGTMRTHDAPTTRNAIVMTWTMTLGGGGGRGGGDGGRGLRCGGARRGGGRCRPRHHRARVPTTRSVPLPTKHTRPPPHTHTHLAEHVPVDAHGGVKQQRRQEGVEEQLPRRHAQPDRERVAKRAEVDWPRERHERGAWDWGEGEAGCGGRAWGAAAAARRAPCWRTSAPPRDRTPPAGCRRRRSAATTTAFRLPPPLLLPPPSPFRSPAISTMSDASLPCSRQAATTARPPKRTTS